MKTKFAVTGLAALLLLGVFLAGSVSTVRTSAKSAPQAGAPAAAAAQSQAQVVAQSQPRAQMAAQAQPHAQVVAQSQPQAQPPAQSQSQTQGTTQQAAAPTEVAGTPEPTEVPGGEQPGQVNEAADAAALASKASITKQQAEAAALAANPGTTVVKSGLGDENGTVVYSVELNNGKDVKVNAQTGAIVSTDAAGNDQAGDGSGGSQAGGNTQQDGEN